MSILTLEPWIDNAELAELTKVIDSTYVTEGTLTEEFESYFRKLTGAKHAISMANGTLALFASLKALGIGAGDEVIVPNLTFAATANAVILAGATPIFCDVICSNFSIDVNIAQSLLSENTKAIMPVHLYGKAADIRAVTAFAEKNGLVVIEDAAQGVGVYYEGQHVGNMSSVGVLSFYGNKTITSGEGGICLTNDDEIANKLFKLKNHGRAKKGTFIHEEIGFNFSFTDLQAAVGISQVKKLPKILDKKFEIYRLYKEKLIKVLPLVSYDRDLGEMPWLNSVRLASPELLQEELLKHNIHTRRFFYPLHMQPCYLDLSYDRGNYFRSECLYDTHLSLPSSYSLNEDNITKVCEIINKFIDDDPSKMFCKPTNLCQCNTTNF